MTPFEDCENLPSQQRKDRNTQRTETEGLRGNWKEKSEEKKCKKSLFCSRSGRRPNFHFYFADNLLV